LPAGVELKLALPDSSPEVRADPGQLHQVLMNLCTNAWQALQGKPGAIELGVVERELFGDEPGMALPAGRYACVSVVDSGQGMSSVTLERIFEPFFTTKAPGVGTGLGLSVVHSIVRGHAGALRVKSSPGHGSTFTIYLPTVAPTEAKQNAADGPESQPGVAVSPRRIAYVDDEQQVAKVIVLQLERRGHAMQAFGSAAELLAVLRESPRHFDVIVTDYNMPNISGLELVQRARQLGARAGFVLTSGYMSDELCELASRAGITQLVKKPETIGRLCAAIAAAAAEASEPVPDAGGA
jgi:CheY-like chemotaxis protein